jgi:hypothetical protein
MVLFLKKAIFLLGLLIFSFFFGGNEVMAGRLDIAKPPKLKTISLLDPPKGLKIDKVERVDKNSLKVVISWTEELLSNNIFYNVYTYVEKKESHLIGNVLRSPLVLTLDEDQPYFYLKIKKASSDNNQISEGEFSESLYLQWERSPLPSPAFLEKKGLVDSIDKSQIEFSWPLVERANKYFIYVVFKGEKKEKIGEVLGTSASVTFPKYGDRFSIGVMAINDYLESDLSPLLSIEERPLPTLIPTPTLTPLPTLFSTPTLTIPRPPVNLRLIQESKKEDRRELEFTFDPAESAEGYNFYAAFDSSFKKIGSFLSNHFFITIPEASPDVTVAITAYNIKGESNRSADFLVKGRPEIINITIQATPINKSLLFPSFPSSMPSSKKLGEKEILEAMTLQESESKKDKDDFSLMTKPSSTPKMETIKLDKKQTQQNLVKKIVESIKNLLRSLSKLF